MKKMMILRVAVVMVAYGFAVFYYFFKTIFQIDEIGRFNG